MVPPRATFYTALFTVTDGARPLCGTFRHVASVASTRLHYFQSVISRPPSGGGAVLAALRCAGCCCSAGIHLGDDHLPPDLSQKLSHVLFAGNGSPLASAQACREAAWPSLAAVLSLTSYFEISSHITSLPRYPLSQTRSRDALLHASELGGPIFSRTHVSHGI